MLSIFLHGVNPFLWVMLLCCSWTWNKNECFHCRRLNDVQTCSKSVSDSDAPYLWTVQEQVWAARGLTALDWIARTPQSCARSHYQTSSCISKEHEITWTHIKIWFGQFGQVAKQSLTHHLQELPRQPIQVQEQSRAQGRKQRTCSMM